MLTAIYSHVYFKWHILYLFALSSYFPACFPPDLPPPILSLALFDTLLCALVSLHSPLGYWGRDCCLKAMRPDQHVLGNQRQLQWSNRDVQISLMSCKERSGESELQSKIQYTHTKGKTPSYHQLSSQLWCDSSSKKCMKCFFTLQSAHYETRPPWEQLSAHVFEWGGATVTWLGKGLHGALQGSRLLVI